MEQLIISLMVWVENHGAIKVPLLLINSGVLGMLGIEHGIQLLLLKIVPSKLIQLEFGDLMLKLKRKLNKKHFLVEQKLINELI